MNRNVEIKARVPDPAALRRRVEVLAGGEPMITHHEDTFFRCPNGRLKLRQVSASAGELIYYRRQDVAGPRESLYRVARTDQPEAVREALAAALGISGVARRRRALYRIGATRVHLDSVEGLGEFVELEVELSPEQTEAEGREIARDLMASLGISASDLIKVAYVDLLEGTSQ